MHYLTVSFTHKNTDIKTREKLALDSDIKLISMQKMLLANESINEVILLSTCNRVEIITNVKEDKKSLKHIFKTLWIASKIPFKELENKADIYQDSGAIHHLFSVASSLDSLVIGETQISGQLKNAYKFSSFHGFCDKKLNKAVNEAFKCAAIVRNKTSISKTPISVSSVAVNKAKEILGGLDNVDALVIGSGEMGELAAKHLLSNGANVIIVSKNTQNAQKLAQKLSQNVKYDDFDNLKNLINSYQLIFSATSSSTPIINHDMLEQKVFKRYFFDIAVPRDIDIQNSENISVFAVDDLQDLVKKNLSLREEQAQEAYKIIGNSTKEFFQILKLQTIEPLIKNIRNQAMQIAKQEMQKAQKKGYLKQSSSDEVQKLLNQALNSFLHLPTKKIKQMLDLPDCDIIIKSLQYIFDIKDEEIKDINLYKNYDIKNNLNTKEAI